MDNVKDLINRIHDVVSESYESDEIFYDDEVVSEIEKEITDFVVAKGGKI